MPPALPPRDSARPWDAEQSPTGNAEPSPASQPAALEAEIDVLRRTVTRLCDEIEGLHRAMRSRAVIDQAKGALRAVTGISGDEAFALLASRSQNTNRKLTAVATDVLATVDSPDRAAAVLASLGHPRSHARPAGDAETSWRPRRHFDPLALAVTDHLQVLALADLAEQLAGAGSRAHVVEVLLGPGADDLGAFGATVASLAGTGSARLDGDGVELAEGSDQVALDAAHPVAEVLRSGRSLVLSRADLALRHPDHPRPARLQGLAVLALGTDTARPAAWSLYFDHAVPADRSTRAMLDRAARMASAALRRAR